MIGALIKDTADLLAAELRAKLEEIREQPHRPISILAHSMGGLVVRALIAWHKTLWDQVMATGGYFVMLGTPNQGSHKLVESLPGKSDAVRQLAMLDFQHDLQEIIEVIDDYDGILQMLPHAQFIDTGVMDALSRGHQALNYHEVATWDMVCACNRDRWFPFQPEPAQSRTRTSWGGLPNSGKKLQAQNELDGLPHADRVAYVFGLMRIRRPEDLG
ncbi:MAG: hypothetical protein R3E95_08715 [Thiolinea sp.]